MALLACQSMPAPTEISIEPTLTRVLQASTTPAPTSTPTIAIPTEEAQNLPAIVVLSPAEKIVQLVGDLDNERGEATLNRTGERYQLNRTDLGVPFQHNGRTYILFGDAWEPPDDPIATTTDTNPEDGLELVFLQNEDGRYRPVD
ncbi:MAG: hypothetical protein V2J07_07520, partial [Anaerolineae bacterium]|nr:hypothetical protein [Anaerolineae bacterium]